MNEGMKVVAAEEMTRIEKKGNHETFMRNAGREVARIVIEYLRRHKVRKIVTLLVGKGNNGGDAYAAGITLLGAGIEVKAIRPLKGETALNRKFEALFEKSGGKFTQKMEGVLVDGLFGTGLKGNIEEPYLKIIQDANSSHLPIIAIDIPSGIHGTTGYMHGLAIEATETVALALPKIGFFLRDGWNHVGRLHVVDFGLSKEAMAEAVAIAYLPKTLHLPKIVRNRHKYQAGYVIGLAGSKELPGAAKLAGLACLKGGAGIVRIFSPDDLGPAPLELICNLWSDKAWKEHLVKAKAVFVGPGVGKRTAWFKKYLKKISLPCVIDADALMADLDFPKHAVLTPHRGEALRLLNLKTEPPEEEFFAKLIRFCERKKVYLVLKGAPTFVFGPNKKPVIITRGDPGMASAGTGDVLTGLIAAFLAQGMNAYEAAILGAFCHGIAGEEAAKEKTSYCITATDLIDFFPEAFRAVAHGTL